MNDFLFVSGVAFVIAWLGFWLKETFSTIQRANYTNVWVVLFAILFGMLVGFGHALRAYAVVVVYVLNSVVVALAKFVVFFEHDFLAEAVVRFNGDVTLKKLQNTQSQLNALLGASKKVGLGHDVPSVIANMNQVHARENNLRSNFNRLLRQVDVYQNDRSVANDFFDYYKRNRDSFRKVVDTSGKMDAIVPVEQPDAVHVFRQ